MSAFDQITNRMLLSRKLYYEYAKATVFSSSYRVIAGCGSALMMAQALVFLIHTIYWQIRRGEFYIFDSFYELFFLYIFPWFGLFFFLTTFILSFLGHRVLVRDRRTGHKTEFFKNSPDGKHVNYRTTISEDAITIDKDGEIEEIGWGEVVGTEETRHFLLLILDVTYVYKLMHPQFVKSNTQPVYVHSAVILGKNSFEQGSMNDLQALLNKKGIKKYNGKGDVEYEVYR